MATDRGNPAVRTVLILFLTVLLAVGIWLAGAFSGAPNSRFTDAAAALTVIGVIAVGIERITEALWAAADMVFNAGWPNKPLSQTAKKVTGELDAKLQPFLDQVTQAVGAASSTAGSAAAGLSAAAQKLDTLQADLAALKANAAGGGDFQKAAVPVLTGIAGLQGMYPQLQTAAATAQVAINDTADFVNTFRDNPGRRLLSIYVGVLLGLAAALVTGLDVFQASLQTAVASPAGFHMGVALTGVVMGLGASPTHEVIEILKQIKLTRQSA